MRYKNLIEKACVILILVALILCLYACSKNDKPNSETVLSTTQSENETEMVFATRVNITKEGGCGDTATWSFDEKSKTLTIKGTGETYENWEPWKPLIEKVVIEEGITTICYGTFKGCTALNEISIPESVKGIGDEAFVESGLYNNPENWVDGVLYIDGYVIDAKENASGIIEIKEGTRSIAAYAFMQCTEITSVTIPDSVRNIGECAFSQCIKLESVSIGKGVKTIADSLFDDPWASEYIVICSSLKNISVDSENPYFTDENGILYNKDKTELIMIPTLCSQKSYVLPDSVTLIRPSAFSYCKTLENVVINNYNITSLQGVWFAGCENLETVVLPYNLMDLGEQTFKFSGISHIVIPDRVSRIGQETFAYCDNLKTITLGSGISEIDESAFAASYALEQINVASGNSSFSSEDGVLFNKDKTELVIYPYAKNAKQYNVPESVEIIKSGVFVYSKNLKKLFIGKNIKTIESYNYFYGEITQAEYDGPTEYSLYDIYYEGTQTQWNKINSTNKSFDEIEARVYFNSSSLPESTTTVTTTVQKSEDKKSNLFDWF